MVDVVREDRRGKGNARLAGDKTMAQKKSRTARKRIGVDGTETFLGSGGLETCWGKALKWLRFTVLGTDVSLSLLCTVGNIGSAIQRNMLPAKSPKGPVVQIRGHLTITIKRSSTMIYWQGLLLPPVYLLQAGLLGVIPVSPDHRRPGYGGSLSVF